MKKTRLLEALEQVLQDYIGITITYVESEEVAKIPKLKYIIVLDDKITIKLPNNLVSDMLMIQDNMFITGYNEKLEDEYLTILNDIATRLADKLSFKSYYSGDKDPFELDNDYKKVTFKYEYKGEKFHSSFYIQNDVTEVIKSAFKKENIDSNDEFLITLRVNADQIQGFIDEYGFDTIEKIEKDLR